MGRSKRIQYQTIEIPTESGGRLMVQPSAEFSGKARYLEKTNFRRDYDVDKLREGWVFFDPSSGINSFVPREFDEDILLIAQFTRPNADKAIVIATRTKIYGLDYHPGSGASDYIEPGYWAEGYVAKDAFSWVLLGSNYAEDGNRWEAVSINGSLFLNNGKDLIQEYRVEWPTCRPLYELREAGVASVGTIAEYRGFLMVADILDISSDDLPDVMNSSDPYGRLDPDDYTLERVVYDLAWSQPADGSRWMPVLRGKIRVHGGRILSATRKDNVVSIQTDGDHDLNAGDLVTIAGVGFAFDAVDVALTATPSRYQLEYANVGPNTAVNPDGATWEPKVKTYTTVSAIRTDGVARIVLSEPHDFVVGELVSVSGMTDTSFNAPDVTIQDVTSDSFSYTSVGPNVGPVPDIGGSAILNRRSNMFLAEYPVISFQAGQSVSIIGAGAGDGTFTTKIQSISGNMFLLEDPAINSSDNGLIRSDAIGAVTARTSLQAESNRIIKMKRLADRFVVFHTGGCFVGYGADGDVPFVFESWYRGYNVPTFRHTLVNVLDKHLMFLGRDGYYQMDFSERAPRRFDLMNLATLTASEEGDDQIENIFAFDNTATREVWFVFQAHAEAYSYRHNDVSIIDAGFTAASMIERLESDKFSDTEAYPVLGKDRFLIRAGVGYHRLGVPYTAAIEGGLMDFGDGWQEKKLLGYAILAGSRSESDSVTVSLYSSSSPKEPATLLETHVLTDLANHNMIPTGYLDTYFKDRIVVDVNGQDFSLTKRIFEIGWIPSRHNTMRR